MGGIAEAQAKKLQAHATSKGIDLEILSDHVSGGNLSRPAMAELLARVEAHQVASVIVYKLDRLTRSVYDLLYLVDLFERTGTALVSLSENLDTSSATGRMFIQIIGVIAEWERGVISERTRDALRHKRASGQVFNHVPYGYDRDGDMLVANNAELAVVKRIVALSESGKSLRSIAATLNGDGIPAKKGGPWIHRAVDSVLRNQKRPIKSAA